MKRQTKFLTMLALLLTTATGAWAADKTAQALWCEGNATLYFINAETVYKAYDTYNSQTVTAAWSDEKVTNTGDNIPQWFYSCRTSAKTVVFDESFQDVRPKSCRDWLYSFAALTEITGIEHLNTSEVTTMYDMFNGCEKLTSLDLSSFDTSKVTDMSSMFYRCYSLVTITFGDHFDTSNVTNMNNMFYSCNALTSLDVSKFNTAKVTNMSCMFQYCESLTSLNLSNFDTSNVTYMHDMFFSCKALTSIDLSHFDTSKVTNMSYMFIECSSLTSLDLSSFNTSNVTNMYDMFYKCESLTSLNLGDHFDTSNVTNAENMFWGCSSMTLSVTLNESVDNSKMLSAANGNKANATLGRTLQTGGWNTFCAPFSVATPTGWTVKTLSGSSLDSETGTLTLTFADAASIEAGKPYLVKVASAVANPLFQSVTISGSTTTTETTCADFVPVMNPTALTGGDHSVLFVTGGNKLTYPTADGNINAFRAYFRLKGDAPAKARAFSLSLGDGTTAIKAIDNLTIYNSPFEAGAWYTLDGRRIEDQPTQKGVYIVNGRKVVVK